MPQGTQEAIIIKVVAILFGRGRRLCLGWGTEDPRVTGSFVVSAEYLSVTVIPCAVFTFWIWPFSQQIKILSPLCPYSMLGTVFLCILMHSSLSTTAKDMLLSFLWKRILKHRAIKLEQRMKKYAIFLIIEIQVQSRPPLHFSRYESPS